MFSPKLVRVLDLSMMGLLLRTDLFAKERSAVIRVIEILSALQYISTLDVKERFLGQSYRMLSKTWNIIAQVV